MKKIFSILLLTVCLNVFSQQPIFVTISGGDLYSLNLTTCTSRFVGSTGQGFGDIAFTPDGRLWGIISGDIYKIDTVTANATLIYNTGIGAVSLVALNDSTLLAEFNMKLYGLNINSATSYYIDTIGYQAAGDLTWYDNDLYLNTGNQLIKIVLNNTNSAILSVTPVNSTSNPIPNCEGTATSTFVGDYNSIIGFSGQDAYKICQIDGSHQLLCSTIVPNSIPGAASIRLPVQNPLPIACSQTSAIESLSNNLKIKISPNPFSSSTNLTANFTNTILTIYNVHGQQVKQIETNSKQTVLSRDNLPSGLYFLRVTKDNKVVASDKLVIVDN